MVFLIFLNFFEKWFLCVLSWGKCCIRVLCVSLGLFFVFRIFKKLKFLQRAGADLGRSRLFHISINSNLILKMHYSKLPTILGPQEKSKTDRLGKSTVCSAFELHCHLIVCTNLDFWWIRNYSLRIFWKELPWSAIQLNDIHELLIFQIQTLIWIKFYTTFSK